MPRTDALIRLPERAQAEKAEYRAVLLALNVDRRKIDVAVARPFEVRIHGNHPDSVDIPAIWEDLEAEVVSIEVDPDE